MHLNLPFLKRIQVCGKRAKTLAELSTLLECFEVQNSVENSPGTRSPKFTTHKTLATTGEEERENVKGSVMMAYRKKKGSMRIDFGVVSSTNNKIQWTGVMAQLTERSLLIPEDPGSNPVMCNFFKKNWPFPASFSLFSSVEHH